MRFTNKICLVTGGGSGIGRATCLRLAREGGAVVVIDLSEEAGSETVQLIKGQQGEAIFIKTDISFPEQIKQCKETVIEYNCEECLFPS